MSMLVRVCLAALVLVAIQLSVAYVQRNRQPTEIRPPSPSLKELPEKLGPLTGQEISMDPRVTAAVRAIEAVDRAYEKQDGGRVVVELAAFDSNELDPPHMPQVCYTKAGWTIKNQTDVKIKLGESTRRARVLSLEQEGQHVHVLYWYQLGEAEVLDAREMRNERWKLFGQRSWPPLVKVMMQTSLSEPSEAEEQMRSFAELVLAWTQQIR